jgi:hypothetical protein
MAKLLNSYTSKPFCARPFSFSLSFTLVFLLKRTQPKGTADISRLSPNNFTIEQSNNYIKYLCRMPGRNVWLRLNEV